MPRRPITDNERKILILLAAGHSYGSAGKELFRTTSTTKAHIDRFRKRHGLATVTAAVAFALRHHLIE